MLLAAMVFRNYLWKIEWIELQRNPGAAVVFYVPVVTVVENVTE